jgi:hypothetical protein
VLHNREACTLAQRMSRDQSNCCAILARTSSDCLGKFETKIIRRWTFMV